MADLLVGALVGGAFAVTAAFVAQRYQHVLSIRLDHHHELVEEVLRPWLGECERQARYLSAIGFSRYVSPPFMEQWGFRFRAGDLGSSLPLSMDGTLWSRGREHWAAAFTAWSVLTEQLLALDGMHGSAVDDLARILPEPPRGCEWDASWDGDPQQGRRVAATRYWGYFWQHADRGDGRTGFRNMATLNDQWKGPDEDARAELVLAAETWLYDATNQARWQALLAEADALRAVIATHRDHLLARIHDKNLRGRCAFCPRFWSRV